MAAPRVLLGVTGGIAAYKSVELLRLLQQAGFDVAVLQTRSSLDFVGAATFAALTGEPTITDEAAAGGVFPHLDAGRAADVLVIAPATAATIARLATGLADDVLAATYLAFEGPVVVAPAMNVRMWEHPATKRNLARLQADGVHVVQPEEGLLACGDVGAGRLAPVERIAAAVQASAGPTERDLEGRVVVVTAGGTREAIDDVRAITNRSSGRMGAELARAALARGAEVRLIATTGVGAEVLAGLVPAARVESAADLRRALGEQVVGADVVLMAAAVSDFTPVRTPGKLERGGSLDLRLEPVPDLIAELAEGRGTSREPLLVAFAAESGGDGVERARRKLERKGVDLVVHNDVSRADIGFEVDRNEVTIVGGERDIQLGPAPKRAIAEGILDAVKAALGRGATVRE